MLSIPLPMFAEERKIGEIQWEIDRILRGNSDEEGYYKTSELTKRFPTLFTVEVSEMIQESQARQDENMQKMKTTLFSTSLDKNKMIEDTKDALFSTDYEAPKSSTEKAVEERKSWVDVLLLSGLSGIAIIGFWVIYMLFKKFQIRM